MPLSTQPLFADRERRQAFPAPVALALELMVSEIEESGEITTADETASVIEAVFTWLGRVWVAEYLACIEASPERADEQANQMLLSLAQARRSPTTGQWVGLARQLRAAMDGYETVVPKLAHIVFGDAVGQLLTFRNHFSHGSFASTLEDIRAHRQLLHDLLAQCPALAEMAPLHRSAVDGCTRRASATWPTVDVPPDLDLPEAHPIMVAPNGRTLDLYPLLHVEHTGSGFTLTGPNATHPVASLTQREALSSWMARYERERQGHLPWTPAVSFEQVPSALAAMLTDDLRGLVLVEGWPGCGARGVIDALCEDNPLQLPLEPFAACQRVQVTPADPRQSGVTLARVVLRLVERALGEPEGHRDAPPEGLLDDDGPLKTALADLEHAGKQVLLGLDNLHEGQVAYRGEPYTVLDTYEALLDSPVTVVATTVPGAIDRPLFDHRHLAPIVDTPALHEVTHWAHRLLDGRALHTRVLTTLSQQGPLPLFDLCDALEASGGDRVFEPAVERALWDMKPLLTSARVAHQPEPDGPTEQVRRWAVFSPVVGQALGTLGGAA